MANRLLVFAVLVLFAVTAWAGDSEIKYCTGDSPSDVLEFYSQAVSGRDIAALRGVYAKEFIHVPGGKNIAKPWGREFEIESGRKLFEATVIESQSFTFSGDYTVEQGEDQDTWVIGGLVASITTKFRDKGKDSLAVSDSGHRLTIKKFDEPVEHFALVKWEAPN